MRVSKLSWLLFDNVNDMSFVLHSRAMFQAKNDVHTLGDSKTGFSRASYAHTRAEQYRKFGYSQAFLVFGGPCRKS